MLRTHNCNELTINDVGKDVTLCGWISARRDHGDIIFMDLRDTHGTTQIVFDPEKNALNHKQAHQLRSEYCVKIIGKTAPRPEGTVNNKIPTGQIEIDARSIEIFSTSDTVPFEIKDDIGVAEETRLKYRYLDLRRPEMQKKLKMKHNVYKLISDFLDNEGFVSVETPVLTKSTPEGARDYLVPSRIQQGSFYALPQSPQIFKQLLMVSGIEKYFQIVRCFRDEDLRADRQPEFTQLDMEMSFVEQDDILDVSERLFKEVFASAIGSDLETPFKRMTYSEAMRLYGSDKPDTRFDVLLEDFTDDLKGGCEFKVFNNVISAGGRVMAIAAPGYSAISRKEIDDLTSFVADYGAKGLAYFKVEEDKLVSPIDKFLSSEEMSLFRTKLNAMPGDMIFFVADTESVVHESLGALRMKIGTEKGLIDYSKNDILWIVDFPLFKFNEEENRWVSEHHPFTAVREEDMHLLEKRELGKIRSTSYDLVLNGSEIGSGSIRIHDREIQSKIFDLMGLSKEECQQKFGFLLEAFKYGPPPHGGIAFGMDRLAAIFTGDKSIREVIPFPKTQKGVCPLTGAPSKPESKQLEELGITVVTQDD